MTPEQRIMDLEERIAELEAALRAVEYGAYNNENGHMMCCICYSWPGEGHQPTCIIGQAFDGG